MTLDTRIRQLCAQAVATKDAESLRPIMRELRDGLGSRQRAERNELDHFIRECEVSRLPALPFEIRSAASNMRSSDAAHCRSRCGSVRRLPLASSQGLFFSAPQVGQVTASIRFSARSFIFMRNMMHSLGLVCAVEQKFQRVCVR